MIKLIQRSRFDPESKENADRQSEMLHRFAGKSKEGQLFFVQIKEDKRSGEKSRRMGSAENGFTDPIMIMYLGALRQVVKGAPLFNAKEMWYAF